MRVARKILFALLVTVFCAVLVALIVWIVLQGYESYRLKNFNRFDPIIRQAARRHNLPFGLIKAVIWQESKFRPDARGKHGEVGLMQVMPGPRGAVQHWADSRCVGHPCNGVLFDPAMNVEIGSWYLAMALKIWRAKGYRHAEELALCAYNAGPGKADQWKPDEKSGEVIGNISYPSTRKYVAGVMDKYRSFLKTESTY